MAVLATVPSTSVLIVTTRAATQGFMHGAWVSAGVVLGDLFFIVLAIAGLAMLIEWLGPFFVAIKIAGALYLVWLGQALWRRSHGMVSTGAEVAPASVFGSFFSGLALTLGDQKAVLFYLGFLPAFVNLGALTVPDTAIVMAAAAVAVGGHAGDGDRHVLAGHGVDRRPGLTGRLSRHFWATGPAGWCAPRGRPRRWAARRGTARIRGCSCPGCRSAPPDRCRP